MIRKLILLLVLLVIAGIAQADTINYALDPSDAMTINVAISPDTKLITVATDGSGAGLGKLILLARQGSDFDLTKNLNDQADYFSSNASGNTTLSIADWSHPALTTGSTWYFALVNTGTAKASGTITVKGSSSSSPESVFQISFSKPATDDIGECDVAPWTDATMMPDGKTTLGDFRKGLVEQAAKNLASEIHSPVPIRVQACWKSFDDSGAHAGAYTLAAAGPGSFFADDNDLQGMPKSHIWYAWAPAQRLAGTYICNIYDSIDCNTPDIAIWYNKAPKAIGNYSDPADAALINTVTMHEMTHGLGFLSMVALSDDASGSCPEKTGDLSQVMINGVCEAWNDAYTEHVGHFSGGKVTAFADMTVPDRAASLTDAGPLVWMDNLLAGNLSNALRSHPAPYNLVQLYKADEIQGGSTLSHLNGKVHHGQMMDAVIQPNNPSTLDLAQPILEKVGWATGPLEAPIAGLWNDPDRSGHGIDLEPAVRDPAGDLYNVMFYTYSDSGRSEFYFSTGRLRDGHYESGDTAGQPAPMARPVYDPVTKKATYPLVDGSLSIDFTSFAAADPACAGHSGSKLAVMHWSAGGQSGSWCISPFIDPAKHPQAEHDINGLWNGGSSDSGWGFSIGETVTDSGNYLGPVLLYYYDATNIARWAEAEFVNYKPGDTTTLYQLTGYGRQSSNTGVTTTPIGTITLNLNTPDDSNPPSGNSTISFTTDDGMDRTNVPVRMLSLPPGK